MESERSSGVAWLLGVFLTVVAKLGKIDFGPQVGRQPEAGVSGAHCPC